MIIKHAVIAAAGCGKRLGATLPKLLTVVNGHRIIEYQLGALKDIEDVRIVVGFEADKTCEIVRSLRSDITFIENKDYLNTNTLQSYYLGVSDLKESFLMMDGDVIPNENGLARFIDHARDGEMLVGIAEATTNDAVFVSTTQGREELLINYFTREEIHTYEWANIAIIPPGIFQYEPTFVYECIAKHLPVKAAIVECLEVDRPSDLEYVSGVLKSDPGYCSPLTC